MINIKHLELKEYLAAKIPDYPLVKKTISIALGIALARVANLPSGSVESARDEYNVQVRENIMRKACEFNEQVIVDVDLVEEVARGHWLIRYNCAYPTPSIPFTLAEGAYFMAKLSGTAGIISKDVHDFCEQQADLMIVTVNKILLIIKDGANG